MSLEEKTCTKCKLNLPVSKFQKIKTKSGFRFKACCNQCNSSYKDKDRAKVSRKAYEEKLKSRDFSNVSQPDFKFCPACKIEKSNKKFSKLKTSIDGLNFNCKDCDKQKRLKNEERLKSRSEVVIPDSKFCTKCKTTKSKDSFSVVLSRKDGLASLCKECQKANSEKYRIKLRARDIDSIELPNTKVCPDCSKELASKNFGRSIHNVDGLNTYCKECHKNRYGLRDRLSGRIRMALKRHLVKKSDHTCDLLGCSLDFFFKYFESKFTGEMSWAKFKRGQIHIDHIVPCSSFDLGDKAEQLKCFHYTNLQPLWALDNLKKSDSLLATRST